MSSNPFRLFKYRQRFFGGIASIGDLSSPISKYNQTRGDKCADAEALRADWDQLGADMGVAIKKYEQLKKR
jgi:hypothetical protein